MKKILLTLSALAFAVLPGCQKYEYNTDFTMPTELVSPATVSLDVTSSKKWNSAGTAAVQLMAACF